MPIIAGELRTSTEGAPCADLAAFNCGDEKIGAEETVNKIVASYSTMESVSLPTLRMTRELPSGDLVGLVALEEGGVGYEHQLFQMPDWKDPIYIAVLALSAPYRGGYRTPGGVPVSHVLLRDALTFAASENGGSIPSMQAVIAPDNAPSRALFRAHGFEMIPTAPELLYVRPKNLSIPGDESLD